MQPDDILLLAVKHAVLAFAKTTGARLWVAKLPSSGMGDDFVSLLADDARVYAHTGGRVYCLDLFSGRILWQDGLTGYGYTTASLALPGGRSSALPTLFAARQKAEAESAATQAANS